MLQASSIPPEKAATDIAHFIIIITTIYGKLVNYLAWNMDESNYEWQERQPLLHCFCDVKHQESRSPSSK